MTMTIDEANAELTKPGAAFEVVEAEIRGITYRVYANTPRSLREVFEASREHGDKTFLVYEDDRWTFAQAYQVVATLAQQMVDRFGVRQGDRVAIAMRNFPEWVFGFWATTSIGAVAVPLNAWWLTDELLYGLRDSGSKLLIVDAERLARLADRLGELPLDVVVARPDGMPPAGVLTFDEVVGSPSADAALPPADIDPEDDATIFYTSGTTGNPKGAQGTHRNILTNLMNLAFYFTRNALIAGADPAAAPTQQPASLLTVPLFHVTGCHSTLVSATSFGNKIVFMHKWDAERALELIERERVTAFTGVPTMAWEILESPSLATRDLSSLSSVAYGGAPAPPELVRRVRERFPTATPGNGYGLTETSSVATLNAGEDYIRHPDSVGRAMAVVDVKVVDPDGHEVPRGEIGELWIKAPNVVKGYWKKPEATAEAITDGWLHSGDVARMDDEGFVYIVDRQKDVVIRGGENVYCAEVEAVIYEHPGVMEAAVIGVPHERLGEEVGVVVHVKSADDVSAEDLRAFVAARLASFKVPAHVWIRTDPLPTNPAGKVLKRQLKEEVLE